ncbi:tyrosine-type recombinase/integrase [Turicibacter sanguinis]|uniref:tyrosine-type recombinase/integrase n=1 Tax=Turicibacter sanguinis TaxID=154288 RepID=UPI0029434B36|nr:tyrosine-type recombinase/integrase [Turicibacter sanguinis]
MLIKDVIKEYVFELQVQNYTPRTIKGYKNNTLRFAQYCTNEFQISNLEEIKALHIKQYIKYLLSIGRSATYTNGILKNLRSFFKYCYKEEYIPTNIALKVDWQREPKVIIKTFDNAEVKRMLDVYDTKTYLNARNKCIVAILFDTGIRNIELCNLSITDVRDTVIYIKGKGRKERVVPISPMLKKIMIRYERVRESYIKHNLVQDDSYFLSQNGRRLTGEVVERVIRKCGTQANVRQTIRCSPHTCRHYYAQAQLINGLDVYSLSRLLGHEDISITKRYLQGIQDNDIIEVSIKTSPLMNLK